MVRTPVRAQRALIAAAALALVAALLPARWLGWTAILADLVNVPLQPLVDAGVQAGRALRPPRGPDAEEAEALRRLYEELDATRALLHGARLEIEELREQVRELEIARRMDRGAEVDLLYARVTGRGPGRAHGPVRLNAGTRDGVVGGATVAVYRGAHLIGRVAEDVSRLSCLLVPVTDPASGLMEAVILPADDPAADVSGAPRLQLSPDGAGGLTGGLDRAAAVEPGDVARLADPLWPASARGMILGTVESVRPRDLQPLLNSITVKPVYEAQRLGSVTLKIERTGVQQETPP